MKNSRACGCCARCCSCALALTPRPFVLVHGRPSQVQLSWPLYSRKSIPGSDQDGIIRGKAGFLSRHARHVSGDSALTAGTRAGLRMTRTVLEASQIGGPEVSYVIFSEDEYEPYGTVPNTTSKVRSAPLPSVPASAR